MVIEGAGAGNVNKDVFVAIKYALSKKVPVVVASRVRYGGVLKQLTGGLLYDIIPDR